MDVLNALNFKEENLALDMALLGALAVGFRDDDIYLHMINVLPSSAEMILTLKNRESIHFAKFASDTCADTSF